MLLEIVLIFFGGLVTGVIGYKCCGCNKRPQQEKESLIKWDEYGNAYSEI
jgi:hypothetical protein